ncbi:MAG: hypothetical protein NT007_09765 [Candidatus Kapabacteria bacterium]|nr:hypothetical protein [Candidatus Kapabacteria bacterium]
MKKPQYKIVKNWDDCRDRPYGVKPRGIKGLFYNSFNCATLEVAKSFIKDQEAIDLNIKKHNNSQYFIGDHK